MNGCPAYQATSKLVMSHIFNPLPDLIAYRRKCSSATSYYILDKYSIVELNIINYQIYSMSMAQLINFFYGEICSTGTRFGTAARSYGKFSSVVDNVPIDNEAHGDFTFMMLQFMANYILVIDDVTTRHM